MFACVGKWILRFRMPLGLAVILASLSALYATQWLQYDDQPQDLFRRNNQEFAQLQRLFDDFGPDDDQLVLVLDGVPLFTPAAIDALWRLNHELKQLASIEDVQSITNVRRKGSRVTPLLPFQDPSPESGQQARREALENPMVAGQFLSRDWQTMLVLAQLKDAGAPMSEIERVVNEIQIASKAVLDPIGIRLRLAGHPAIRVDLINKTREERSRFAWLSAIVSALISLVMFRRFAAIFICVMGPAVGVLWTMGLLGALGQRIDVLGTIIPALLYIIGFTDSVHFMASFRQARGAGMNAPQAALSAVSEVGAACALTFFSTFVAFGSLYLAELDVMQRFGMICACGSVLTYLSVLIVIPVLMSTWVGERAGATLPKVEAMVGGKVNSRTDIARWWTNLILRHSRVIAILGIGLTAYLAFITTKLKPDIRWTESLPPSSDTKQVIEHCDKTFGGSGPIHVVVEWPSQMSIASPGLFRVVADIHDLMKKTGYTAEPFSIGNVASALSSLGPWKAEFERLPSRWVNRIVRTDLRRLLVTAKIPDAGAAQLEPVFQKLESQLAELELANPGFSFHLTGTSLVAARNVNFLIGDLAKSLSATAAIVIVIMIVAFRSLKLGLIGIFPNLLPLLMTAGCIHLAGQPLGIASVLTFDLCLGIAVDDTIHFIMRYRHEKRHLLDKRETIVETLHVVGGAMILTSVVLIGGFSVMIFSQLPPLRTFAQLSCTTLATAVVCDLVVLPVLLYLFDSSERQKSPE